MHFNLKLTNATAIEAGWQLPSRDTGPGRLIRQQCTSPKLYNKIRRKFRMTLGDVSSFNFTTGHCCIPFVMSAIYAPLPSSLPTASAYINPAQMQNALAGPSAPAQQPPKKKPTPYPKRKRTDTSDDQGEDSASQPRKGREGPKKKKANRACFHCQKAHLTCDDCM
jgi:hypothetical protein